MKRFLTLILLGLLIAAEAMAAPPFVNGEVAVYAEPYELTDYTVKKFLPNARISVIQVETGKEWGQVQKLRAKGKKAGLNYIASKSAAPNDPFYKPHQWHFVNIQAEDAWDITTGSGVTVAVLDTGLAISEGDGIGCVAPGIDIVNGDNDPYDGDSHGTHVSGTIAQTTNNGTGVAGLAHDACIMPVKVLDDSGSGSFSDIADGIAYAVANGADVINMSLGVNARSGMTNDPIVDPALDHAYSSGVTVVCASGNDGSRKNVSYPAIYPTTIAVGATDYRNNVVRYSNKGEGLDLVAPGGDTGRDDNKDGYGDGVLQETLINGSWGYYFFQGTSMASPHVAAAAAMLIAHETATTPDDIKNVLTSSALDIGDSGVDSTSGAGLLQVHAALTGSTSGGGDTGGGDTGGGDTGGGDTGGTDTCTDNDKDGYCANMEPFDCYANEGVGAGPWDGWADNESIINPGAKDRGGPRWRDGIDNNCNGIIDG